MPSTPLPPPTPTLSVLIADSQPLARRGLRHLLSSQTPWKVAEVRSVRDARVACEREVPALIVIEAPLDGWEALRFIGEAKGLSPEVRVVALLPEHECARVLEAMGAGAHGCFLRSDDEHAVMKVVEIVMMGRLNVSPPLKQTVLAGLQPRSAAPSRETVEELSGREQQVFRCRGTGMSRGAIAQAIGRSPRTVDAHLDHIKTKLGFADREALDKAAREFARVA